jgi:hypothetical protein
MDAKPNLKHCQKKTILQCWIKSEQEKNNIKEITKRNLISWGLLTEREGEIFPTNAFILMTVNDFPQAKIQCAVFKGTTRNIGGLVSQEL